MLPQLGEIARRFPSLTAGFGYLDNGSRAELERAFA
jgi:hypothetical protein